MTSSRSWTRSTYARDAAPISPRPSAPELDELLEPLAQRVGRRVDDGHRDLVRLLGAPDRLLVEERHDGLAERHALDREQAVPAGVQLVDDDVGVAVQRERLLVVEPFDDPQVDVEARRTRGGRDRCPCAAARTGRGRRRAALRPDGGTGRIADRSTPGGIITASGHPADRVVAADDLRARLLPVRELVAATSRGCPSRGSASPTACRTPAAAGTGATAGRASGRT